MNIQHEAAVKQYEAAAGRISGQLRWIRASFASSTSSTVSPMGVLALSPPLLIDGGGGRYRERNMYK
jgi:hypothetical protein